MSEALSLSLQTTSIRGKVPSLLMYVTSFSIRGTAFMEFYKNLTLANMGAYCTET